MNYRQALAASSVGVVVFAIVLALLLVSDRPVPADVAAPQIINDLNVAEIAAVAVNNRSGAYGLMISADGAMNLVAEPEIAGAEYSQEEMQGFVYLLAKLNASQMIASPGNLADFGLEPPRAKLALILKDGRTLRFRLGNASPAGDTYYFQKDGEPRVYLIGKLAAELMLRARTDYWDRQLLPRLDSQSIARLQSVSLASAGSPTQNWRLEHLGASAFHLAEPMVAAVSTDKVLSQLLLPASAFRPEKFVALASDASDFTTYGLDRPDHVLTVEFDGKTYRLLFAAHGNGAYRVARSDSPAVFSVAADKAAFLTLGYRDLLGDYVYNGSMAALANVAVTRAGRTTSILLHGEGQQLYGIVAGVSIPYAQLVPALAPLYRIGVVGEVKDDERAQVGQALRRPPLATVTISKRDGRTDMLEFFARDDAHDGQSFVRSNGQVSFIAYSQAALALEQALEQAGSLTKE